MLWFYVIDLSFDKMHFTCTWIDFIVFNKWIWIKWFRTSLICSFICCGFVMNCQRGRLLGHMCFTWLRTYVVILCNWLILWQNALYLYLDRFYCIQQVNMSWVIYYFSYMFIFLLWFYHRLPKGEIVRTYVFYMIKNKCHD